MILLFLLGGLFSQSYTDYSYMWVTKPNKAEAKEQVLSIADAYSFPFQFKQGKSRSPFIIDLKDDLCNANTYRNADGVWVIEVRGN